MELASKGTLWVWRKERDASWSLLQAILRPRTVIARYFVPPAEEEMKIDDWIHGQILLSVHM